MTFNEIVKITGLPKATVSHALHRLEKKRFVYPFYQDGKIKWALTFEGLAFVTPSTIDEETTLVLESLVSKLEEKSLEDWTDEDWQTLFETFKLTSLGRHVEISPQIYNEIRKLLIQAWPKIKNSLSIEFAYGLLLSFSLLNIITREEDLKNFFQVHLPTLLLLITKTVDREFISILRRLMPEKFESFKEKLKHEA